MLLKKGWVKSLNEQIKRIDEAKIPNWILENDWSDKSRLEWCSRIMAFSSRDWSVYNSANGMMPDSENGLYGV